MDNNNITFEEAYKELEACVEKLNLVDNSLEDAIKAYNEGIRYYEFCNNILNDCKQKIEIIDK